MDLELRRDLTGVSWRGSMETPENGDTDRVEEEELLAALVSGSDGICNALNFGWFGKQTLAMSVSKKALLLVRLDGTIVLRAF